MLGLYLLCFTIPVLQRAGLPTSFLAKLPGVNFTVGLFIYLFIAAQPYGSIFRCCRFLFFIFYLYLAFIISTKNPRWQMYPTHLSPPVFPTTTTLGGSLG
uniref:Uncharacterized protein n=1 Tax=Micrurus carvalhoi TaxID=3147026 RepID=A0A2H6MV14_9SAUR